ncbi:AER019Cp [Eremothecium gossypii ATCC 10895]|uniref:AER019Cp n=1 Tax=Eremothecium gossypii (strain ATCC 10895 / CBS 109.51 / FGSC 9923 / NRRL Y-1056) TaxID=284811 RepID=Q757J4_EREGS|nr:AER019Cp [Eremothecium gossypii ATCC 10895]AAS52703.1 AER019Cp [Eremothecium gossypii ATCC 10895]AEY97009.1 FAER019Cp [Eremothecium gossypii FDAG1]
MNKHEEEILTLVQKDSYKQAINAVSKVVRQFPSSTYFRLLEQYVRFKQSPSKYQYELMLGPLLEANTTLPHDAKSLDLLRTFLLELYSPIPPLKPYETAMKKYPTFDLCYRWFQQAIQDLDFNSLNRATFQLSRFCKDVRAAKFWNAVVLLSWARVRPATMAKQEQQLLPQLAYKILVQLKPYPKEEELVVFCQVCELLDEDKAAEIVDEILTFWGAEKANSLDLYLKDLLLDNLLKLERHADLYEVCGKLLVHLDDFVLCKTLAQSAHKLGLPRADVESQLPATRNGLLTHLELGVLYNGRVTTDDLQPYLARFHDKTCCPVDLEHYMEHIDRSQLLTLFSSFERSIDHDVNWARICPETTMDQFSNLFLEYRPTLLTKPDTNYSCCSHLILQLVQNLVVDSRITLGNVLTAISLLESYQAQDAYNYDTRIWLIVLYQYLGITPAAHKHYENLKVKNVQNDIVDHLLYTRYASFFPNKSHPYVQALCLAEDEQPIYQSLGGLPTLLKIAFERKSYTKLPGMFSFYDQLRRSIMRWHKIGEHLKLLRICNDKRASHLKRIQMEILNLNLPESNSLADNRDFNVVFETANDKNAFSTLSGYMRVDDAYVRLQLCQEFMLEGISAGAFSPVVEILAPAQKDFKQFTRYEKWAWDVISNVYEHMDDIQEEFLMDHLQKIPDFGLERDWKLVHGYSTVLLTLKTLDGIKRIKSPTLKKLMKDQLQHVRGRCSSIFDEYAEEIATCSVDIEFLSRFGCQPASESATQSLREVFKALRNL